MVQLKLDTWRRRLLASDRGRMAGEALDRPFWQCCTAGCAQTRRLCESLQIQCVPSRRGPPPLLRLRQIRLSRRFQCTPNRAMASGGGAPAGEAIVYVNAKKYTLPPGRGESNLLSYLRGDSRSPAAPRHGCWASQPTLVQPPPPPPPPAAALLPPGCPRQPLPGCTSPIPPACHPPCRLQRSA
jgi:hypothetical protein